MSWTNGFYNITSNGDLTSFFEALRDSLPTYTGFTVAEFMPEDTFSITFDTKIGGITLKLSSDATSSVSKQSIEFTYISKNNITLKSNSIAIQGSNAYSTALMTRALNFHTFENSVYKNFAMCTWNSNYCTCHLQYDIGTAKVKSILDDTSQDMYFCGNEFYNDDTATTLYSLSPLLNNLQCSGVCMLPFMLKSSDNSSDLMATHYLEGLYASSDASYYKKYKIGNKQYIALYCSSNYALLEV